MGISVIILHRNPKGTISSATAGIEAKHSDDGKRWEQRTNTSSGSGKDTRKREEDEDHPQVKCVKKSQDPPHKGWASKECESSATAGRNVVHARDGTWDELVKPKEKSEDHPQMREEKRRPTTIGAHGDEKKSWESKEKSEDHPQMRE
jgi:hypothetical protein